MRDHRPPVGLYHPSFEHDACGLGAVVRLDGRCDHELLRQALAVLANLDHRGATGADPMTGDGAGITTQMPHHLLREVCREQLRCELPAPGHYAAGLVFLPRDPGLRLRCEELCIRICAEEGHRALGWREVPVREAEIGALAAASAPVIQAAWAGRMWSCPHVCWRRTIHRPWWMRSAAARVDG
jgi:glutamate synthase (NADPH/NADH) large chain